MERRVRIDDLIYYRRRLVAERRAASVCEDNMVALAHLKMADEYQRRIDLLAEAPAPLALAGTPIPARNS
jgi:hypothetical protein